MRSRYLLWLIVSIVLGSSIISSLNTIENHTKTLLYIISMVTLLVIGCSAAYYKWKEEEIRERQ
ncbi:hypothetical protein GCM10010954_11940 [Halobacillus andaensis]|uniref:Uncharacterized protein n=1 Tax=Halobacillus andaensis TaxID=1176239 RepID=A0A917B1L3_HALAA|nr:hypothetical protein [Halobacillus andaensis]MBP2003992.1 membrane protein DedA with SNARE-associated domain [Halobacillus andaensis]GGF14966.1 hypothetical protein GCM10010954_11940 [Halobacillus andaensis]